MTQKALKRKDLNALRFMFKKRGIKAGSNLGSSLKRDRKFSEKTSSKKPMDE